MHWDRGAPLTWTTRQPSEPLLEQMLLRLRPMIAQDPINVIRIHNVCERALSNPEMRAFLRDVRREWKAAQRQGPIALRIDERDIRPDHLADLIFNAEHFHDEPGKLAELEQILGAAGLFPRHMFIQYVYSAVEAVSATGDVVRIALERDLFDWT